MSRIRRAKPDTGKQKDYCRKSGKIRYSTRKAAAGSSNVVAKLHDREINIYKCPHCGDWHLTRRPQGGETEKGQGTGARALRHSGGNGNTGRISSHFETDKHNRSVSLDV